MIKVGAPVMVSVKITDSLVSHNDLLWKVGHELIVASKRCATAFEQSKRNDHRLMRAHLMLEELGELLHALMHKDEVELADAIADLTYVVAGTAVSFDIPYQRAFEEAHRSNMSKDRGATDRSDASDKGKGVNFVRPDFAAVLAKHREG